MRRDRTAFLLILAFGAALRFFHLTAPFVDAHAWRQLDTAAMARNFYEGSFLPFDPRVDWGGRYGYLEAECPLIPALIALLYKVTGLHETVGRLVIIAFSLGLIWATSRLAMILDGRRAVANGAAFLVAVSPACIMRAMTISFYSIGNGIAGWYENWRHGPQVRAVTVPPPLFVLGHWRSGTTHLHNLLAEDAEQFAFANNYQVFNPRVGRREADRLIREYQRRAGLKP